MSDASAGSDSLIESASCRRYLVLYLLSLQPFASLRPTAAILVNHECMCASNESNGGVVLFW